MNSSSSPSLALTASERLALAMGRFANKTQRRKLMQIRFLRAVTQAWVRPSIASRVYADGADWLVDHPPDRGVVLVANHRSFFDMYVVMLALFERGLNWVERLYFPVRANFFYEHPFGVALNLMVGGGVMYPPIYRDRAKAAYNKDALDRVAKELASPGTVVGLHPEGTRGKGANPYELLPAQPGVGQIVLRSQPIVVPIFINGLPNDIRRGIGDTFRKNARRDHPIIVCFGPQLDYSDLAAKPPRAALYKRCADLMLARVAELGERERAIRQACASGEITDSDRNWLR